MKKLISWIIILILFVSSIPAFSEDDFISISLPEIDMTIDIPDYLLVITREMTLTDSGLLEYGISQEMYDEYIEELIASDIYLSTLDDFFGIEIKATSNSQFKQLFDVLNEDTLPEISAIFENTYTNGGVNFIGAEIYNHKQVDFLSLAGTIDYEGSNLFSMQFMTCYSEKQYMITFNIVNLPVDTMLNLAYAIIDSVEFGKTTKNVATGKTFRDETKGIQFVIPTNWDSDLSSITDDSIDYVVFNSGTDSIIYGYMALSPNDLSLHERILASMNKLDNSQLTDEDLATLAQKMGLDPSYGSRVEYNGIEYYRVDMSSILGVKNYSYIEMLRFDNYRIHILGCMLYGSSTAYKDFEQLLSSVEYIKTN